MNNKELEILTQYSLANVQPWQKDLYTRLNGMTPGEMTIMSAGRQTGKSMLSAWANHIHSMTPADPVDDPVTKWYKEGVEATGLEPHKKTVDQ
jgi:hypothetical protein